MANDLTRKDIAELLKQFETRLNARVADLDEKLRYIIQRLPDDFDSGRDTRPKDEDDDHDPFFSSDDE